MKTSGYPRVLVGRKTAVRLKADLLGYARFGRVVAGANLGAIAVRSDRDANNGLYGIAFTTHEVVIDRRPGRPDRVGNWGQALALLFPRPGADSDR